MNRQDFDNFLAEYDLFRQSYVEFEETKLELAEIKNILPGFENDTQLLETQFRLLQRLKKSFEDVAVSMTKDLLLPHLPIYYRESSKKMVISVNNKEVAILSKSWFLLVEVAINERNVQPKVH